MLLAHKIFATISLIVFSLLFQAYFITNYPLFQTLDTFNKVFTITFQFLMIGFLWALLDQSKLKTLTILKLLVLMFILNICSGIIITKFTDLTDIYVKREYASIDKDLLETNPAVVEQPLYKEFKTNMDKVDPFGLSAAKKNYYNIKSVNEYMADLIRITTTNSNLSELKVKLAEIDNDHYITVKEYDSFIKIVNTLPDSKESQVYKTIYSRIR